MPASLDGLTVSLVGDLAMASENQIGLLDTDPREEELPSWAQDLLHRYRLALRVIGQVHKHIIRPQGAVITISGIEPGMRQGAFIGEVKADPFYPEPTEADRKVLEAWSKHTLKRDDPSPAEIREGDVIEGEFEAPVPFPHYNEHTDSAYQVGKDRDDR